MWMYYIYVTFGLVLPIYANVKIVHYYIYIAFFICACIRWLQLTLHACNLFLVRLQSQQNNKIIRNERTIFAEPSFGQINDCFVGWKFSIILRWFFCSGSWKITNRSYLSFWDSSSTRCDNLREKKGRSCSNFALGCTPRTLTHTHTHFAALFSIIREGIQLIYY